MPKLQQLVSGQVPVQQCTGAVQIFLMSHSAFTDKRILNAACIVVEALLCNAVGDLGFLSEQVSITCSPLMEPMYQLVRCLNS